MIFVIFEFLSNWRAARKRRNTKAAYMKKAGGDEKCPHCDLWASERCGWAKHEQDVTRPELDRLTCQCGGQSLWLYGPGVFLLIETVPKEAP